MRKRVSFRVSGCGARLQARARAMPRALVLTFVVSVAWSVPVPAQDKATATYQIFGGGTYARVSGNSAENAFGWDGSISQYPYESRRWVGGEIAASGRYSSEVVEAGEATFSQRVYAYVAGPTFTAPARYRYRVKPFAHALVGAVVIRSKAKGMLPSSAGDNGKTDQTSFGTDLGVGVDVPAHLPYGLTVRGEGDWLSFSQHVTGRVNDLRVTAGIVWKF